MYGISKEKRDAGKFGKSKFSMRQQRLATAQLLNKDVDDVTREDMIGLGNYQAIQKLYDLSKGKDDGEWHPTFTPSSERINLSGTGYKDENGNSLPDIPLNIPTHSNQYDNIKNRIGASFVNPNTRINVTEQAAQDTMQNVFAPDPKADAPWNVEASKDTITMSDVVDGLKTIGTTIAGGFSDLADMGIDSGLWLAHKVGLNEDLDKMTADELIQSTAGQWLGLRKNRDGTINSTLFEGGKDVLIRCWELTRNEEILLKKLLLTNHTIYGRMTI